MQAKNNFISRLNIADTFRKASRCVARKRKCSGYIVRDSFANENELFQEVYVEFTSTFQGLLEVLSSTKVTRKLHKVKSFDVSFLNGTWKTSLIDDLSL